MKTDSCFINLACLKAMKKVKSTSRVQYLFFVDDAALLAHSAQRSSNTTEFVFISMLKFLPFN